MNSSSPSIQRANGTFKTKNPFSRLLRVLPLVALGVAGGANAQIAQWVADDWAGGTNPWVDRIGGAEATIAAPTNSPVKTSGAIIGGVANSGIVFDGVDDYFSVSAAQNPIVGKTSVTIVAFFNTSQGASGAPPRFWYYPGPLHGETGFWPNDWGLTYDPAGNAHGFFNNSITPAPAVSLIDGQPHTMIMTWQDPSNFPGAVARLYVDGVFIGSPAPLDGGDGIVNNGFVIGTEPELLSSFFSGAIGELRFYDTIEDPVALHAELTSTWDETASGGGDAGEFPASGFQSISNAGTIKCITGEVQPLDRDAYVITITDPAAFYATTSDFVDAQATASFDTQLWLFTLDGTPILWNDDAAANGTTPPGNSTFHSAITDPANFAAWTDGGTASASVGANAASLTPGSYVLVIAGFNSQPQDTGGTPIFDLSSTGLDGPALGAGPFAHWAVATPATGTYTIKLAGAHFGTINPTTWDETANGGGDAGEFPASGFQSANNANTIKCITGEVQAFDRDAYLIHISDPAAFYATTSDFVDAQATASFDTQLWLFTLDGTPVLWNDDAAVNGTSPGDASYRSAITDPANFVAWTDGGTASASVGANAASLTPGTYVLVIAGWSTNPQDTIPTSLFDTGASDSLDGPNLSAGPFAQWVPITTPQTGTYTMKLAGASLAALSQGLIVTSVTRLPDQSLTIEWNAQPGGSYAIEGSTTLLNGSWITLGLNQSTPFTLPATHPLLDPAAEDVLFLRARNLVSP